MSRTGAVAILTMLFALSAVSAADDALPGADWLARAQAEIERSEYRFAAAEDGAVTAPNRAHDLRTRVTAQGIEVTSRTGSAFTLRLSASAWGRGTMLVPLEPGGIAVQEEQVSLDRGVLVERYINDSRGLEQVFDVPVPPPGPREAGPLVLEQAIEGDVLGSVAEDGASVLFRDAAGKPVARLADLVVRDSLGAAVPAVFRIAGGRLRLEMDDKDAVYPLLVDPLLASPSWTTESNQANAFFGFSVGPAGDVNGDGFSDVLVGAYRFDNGQTDEGRAFLYLGSASGLSTSAARTFESNQAAAFFGAAVSTAGDLNADGFDDFAVGADHWDGGETDEGAVFVYTGAASAAGIALATTLEPNVLLANFGGSLAHGGDVDGDGDAELVVGASFWSGGQSFEGAMFVYFGDPATVIAAAAPFRAESNQANAHLGAVAGGVDVNADGFADVFAGAAGWDGGTPDVGRVLGFYGSAAGLPATPSWTEDGFGGGFGSSVGATGDTNGDGYADLAIGAPTHTASLASEGRLYLYRGSSSGLLSSATSTRDGGQAGALLGRIVAPAGDVNGDGFADLAASASGFDTASLTNAGKILVWHGSASGIPVAASWTYEGTQAEAGLGEALFAAGDVNADGYADLLVGAQRHDAGQTDEGRAFVFLGSGDGPVTSPTRTLEPEAGSAYEDFGWSVAAAGDVNADGFGDVIVGDPQLGGADSGGVFVFLGTATGPGTAPSTTIIGGQFSAGFGEAIAGAGDVNGDGYDDIVVGAPHWDIDEEEDDGNGRIFVYHGGPAGVDAVADFQNTPLSGLGIFDRHAGEDVAGVGDLNGDGFADVMAGLGISDGRAYVYYGSASGLTLNPADNVEGEFVQAAGDVNGDGYADVVTAHGGTVFDDPVAYLYLGGTPKMDESSDWTRSAQFECVAHPAGDVNGDGFADLVLHTFFQNGATNELYLGGPSGPGATAFQNLSFTPTPATPAGDVNGDGFSDLLVRSGAETLRIYLGSGTGYAASPAWTVGSPNPGDGFGASFAGAGDVNGDGFSDVMAGAPDFDGNNAQLYLGGGGDALEYIPRNFRGDNTGPVALFGKSGSGDRFRILSRGRTARGRGLVAMDHQVAPVGGLLSAGTLLLGSYFDTGTTDSSGAGVNFNRQVTGLSAETPYKWRMRFRAKDPIFRYTRWISLPGNTPEEIDIRTSCLATTWFRDQDGDGFGTAGTTLSACTQPTGYVAVSGDCNDTNGAMFPGNPEVCDGLDNNCAGGIDDGFVAPTGRPVITAKKSGGSIVLDWPDIAGADRYDTVRGRLLNLRSSAGDYSASIDLCVGNDTVAVASDPTVPSVNSGLFYLVRAINCTAEGTYDETHSRQVGLRDTEIEASGNACP